MMKKLIALVFVALMLASSVLAYYPQGYGIQQQNTGWGGVGSYNLGRQVQATTWNTNYYGNPYYSQNQPYGGQWTGASVIYSGPYSRVKPFQYGQVSYGGYSTTGYGFGMQRYGGYSGGYGINPFSTGVVRY